MSPRREHLSVKEAAAILKMSPQRVGFYIRRGDLRATSWNGLDYVLNRQDVLDFHRQRKKGERQTQPGRPGPEQLARLAEAREEAARNRERLQDLLTRPLAPARPSRSRRKANAPVEPTPEPSSVP